MPEASTIHHQQLVSAANVVALIAQFGTEKPVFALRTLCLVCRAWHAIILADTGLWARICRETFPRIRIPRHLLGSHNSALATVRADHAIHATNNPRLMSYYPPIAIADASVSTIAAPVGANASTASSSWVGVVDSEKRGGHQPARPAPLTAASDLSASRNSRSANGSPTTESPLLKLVPNAGLNQSATSRTAHGPPYGTVFDFYAARMERARELAPVLPNHLHPIEGCKMRFACPFFGEQLTPTGHGRYHCSECNRTVVSVGSQEQLVAARQQGHCVTFHRRDLRPGVIIARVHHFVLLDNDGVSAGRVLGELYNRFVLLDRAAFTPAGLLFSSDQEGADPPSVGGDRLLPPAMLDDRESSASVGSGSHTANTHPRQLLPEARQEHVHNPSNSDSSEEGAGTIFYNLTVGRHRELVVMETDDHVAVSISILSTHPSKLDPVTGTVALPSFMRTPDEVVTGADLVDTEARRTDIFRRLVGASSKATLLQAHDGACFDVGAAPAGPGALMGDSGDENDVPDTALSPRQRTKQEITQRLALVEPKSFNDARRVEEIMDYITMLLIPLDELMGEIDVDPLDDD